MGNGVIVGSMGVRGVHSFIANDRNIANHKTEVEIGGSKKAVPSIILGKSFSCVTRGSPKPEEKRNCNIPPSSFVIWMRAFHQRAKWLVSGNIYDKYI